MKVFFAVDGSSYSIDAVRQVGQLLAPSDEVAVYFAPPEVVVRHAVEADEMKRRAQQAISDAVVQEARARLPDALAAKCTPIVVQHTPREGILLEADKWQADVIVVGARGLTPLDQLLLGSVSKSVVHGAGRSVFVARPNPEHRRGQPLRVLYAYDGSAGCTAALRFAERFTLPPHTEVIAATVIEPIGVSELPEWIVQKARDADTEAMAQGWEREHEEERRQAHDQLHEFMAKQPAPFHKAEVLVLEGSPAEQILKTVQQRQVDLIVVGSVGKGMLERMLIGSTSDKLLNHAPCSVLVARG